MVKRHASSAEPYDVLVIGAGPIGLAAAAHALGYGLRPLVVETGSHAGAAVREWGHVRMFSMWRDLVDPIARKQLLEQGWQAPVDSDYPTGRQWVDEYVTPLARQLGDHILFDTRVVGVARQGRDLVIDDGRERTPFVVHVIDQAGNEGVLRANAVVDASGTWMTPKPLGGDGLAAVGERGLADSGRIVYRLPDLSDPSVETRYRGRRVAVAGSGHSALTALVAFAELASRDHTTRISWILRRPAVGNTFGGGVADELPARGALGQRAQAAVDAGMINVVTGLRTEEVRLDGEDLTLIGDNGMKAEPFDEVVALTGFRPDVSWLSEIRLSLDVTLQAPFAVAPLIDPNVHSCGTVSPHGVAELTHAEPGFFQIGMKSYGRAPTFLALTGFEQARSVVAEIAGDHEAAARVDLQLPDTGLCGGSGVFEPVSVPLVVQPADSCCSPAN
jgi:hypothetical protein